MGFENPSEVGDNSFIHLFWMVLTLFSLIFTIVGWWIGNKEKPLWIIDYCSLRFSIFSFLVCIAISLVVTFFAKDPNVSSYIDGWWPKMLVFSMFLLYSNFVASSIEIWNKAQKGKNEILSEKEALMRKCTEINNSVNSLQGVGDVDTMLTMDAAD